jgi:hypothetical protein
LLLVIVDIFLVHLVCQENDVVFGTELTNDFKVFAAHDLSSGVARINKRESTNVEAISLYSRCPPLL